ncbi:uncharacterized protein GGS22DRAFT_197771 [Annulohypoxylon maeteangense]|uniref:uncharacterized protein n=1 Tax=Annulohypoxylon maeteangense TaxID=1927788 RepID=UPI002007E0B8|nr:uncharacterized protein GGS22DRAFT_197771 [Annulohypoxylon maeteangense]KAI0887861.1 hypothetical protein GGS22DRAFT_197771 [Annulohypoxylon maeteangense]
MAMALDPEAPPDAWLSDLAYHLSWELWMLDHHDASTTELSQIFGSDGVPDVPPQQIAQEAKKKLSVLRMEMQKNGGKIDESDPDFKKAEAECKKEEDKKEFKDTNTWWNQFFRQKRNDTVAVALCNEEILIAANVKAGNHRYIKKGGRGKHRVGPYGFHDGRFINTIQSACKAFKQIGNRKIYLLTPTEEPPDMYENMKRHAEMQIYRYRHEFPESIKAIGVSKLACRKCRMVMDNNGIRYVDRAFDFLAHPIPPEEVEITLRDARITNWLDPFDPEFGDVVAEQLGHRSR